MIMKSRSAIILITLLSLLLFSCEHSEENDFSVIAETLEDDFDIVSVIVDKEKVVTSYEADLPDDLHLPEVSQSSYSAVQVQSYEKWTRTYAVYYPAFTDVTEYSGIEVINNYYAERAEKDKEQFKDWEIEDTVIDMAVEHHHFYYQTYEVGYVNTYLSVLHCGVQYMGGAHTLTYYSADNFNMRTGGILTLENLFGNEEIYRPILNQAICKNLMPQTEKLFPINLEETDIISKANNLQFRITENGVEFIFQEYEIAPYSSGAIFVTVPYEELNSILKVKAKIRNTESKQENI